MHKNKEPSVPGFFRTMPYSDIWIKVYIEIARRQACRTPPPNGDTKSVNAT